MDDAHTLLALAAPGLAVDVWAAECHGALERLALPRRRELIRILRDDLLAVDASGRIAANLFLRYYWSAPASAQVDLLDLAWALSHPISLLAAERLVAPALVRGEPQIPLARFEDLVRANLNTRSAESVRKTRTVVLGALERVGSLVTRGTGQHRSLSPSRGTPHPLAFGWLVERDLAQRRADAMFHREVVESSLPVRISQCLPAHAERALAWCVASGVLSQRGDEISAGKKSPSGGSYAGAASGGRPAFG
jgi:hypothetical protein